MGRERVNICVPVKTGKGSPRDGCRCGLCVCVQRSSFSCVQPGVAGVPKAPTAALAGKEGYFQVCTDMWLRKRGLHSICLP